MIYKTPFSFNNRIIKRSFNVNLLLMPTIHQAETEHFSAKCCGTCIIQNWIALGDNETEFNTLSIILLFEFIKLQKAAHTL